MNSLYHLCTNSRCSIKNWLFFKHICNSALPLDPQLRLGPAFAQVSGASKKKVMCLMLSFTQKSTLLWKIFLLSPPQFYRASVLMEIMMQSKSHGTDRNDGDNSLFCNLSCNMKLLSKPCQHGNRCKSPHVLMSLPCMHGAGSPCQLVTECHRTKENDRNVSLIIRTWEPSKRYVLET